MKIIIIKECLVGKEIVKVGTILDMEINRAFSKIAAGKAKKYEEKEDKPAEERKTKELKITKKDKDA